MTPHHLHALAAAWSLHTARQHLADLARNEGANIAGERLQAADGLRSPTWDTRHASGGHGDPTTSVVLTGQREPRTNRWAELVDRADQRIAGIARLLQIAQTTPLAQIRHAIPHLQPGAAAVVARHLVDEDTWIRTAAGLAPDRRPLPGVDCPACGHRQLYVQTAAPIPAWTVVCLAVDCRLCTGQGCRCGMPGAVEGVAHIWLRSAVIAGAVAGATPTTTTN